MKNFLKKSFSYHKKKEVVDKLVEQGVNLHFLGPYSWESSPSEYAFAW